MVNIFCRYRNAFLLDQESYDAGDYFFTRLIISFLIAKRRAYAWRFCLLGVPDNYLYLTIDPMSKRIIYITFPVLLLAGIYFLGPEPSRPVWDTSFPAGPQQANDLEKYVAQNESRHKVKPDNEARIVWADSTHAKTEYSVVYLHGFSASQGEGDPVHKDFARKFGCNLYLARLADHGIDTSEQLLAWTPDRCWASAKEALAIGKALGEKVIVMGTSTGATMGLMLAAEYPGDVYALINLSPNIRVFHPLAFIANDPWGTQIARMVVHDKYYVSKPKPGQDFSLHCKYWNQRYRLEAIGQLQELLEDKMTPATFGRVRQPSLSLYYYKNEAEQDSVVRVRDIIEMNQYLGTPDSLKTILPIPGAGDHVMGSFVKGKDIPAVEAAIDQFAVEKLRLRKHE